VISTYFNQHAENWDDVASERNAGKLEALAEKLRLKPGMTVLDVGTGTGVLLPYLLKRVQPDGKVLALDVANRMLVKARGKSGTGGVDYTCACIRYTPFVAELFDAVVCYSSFPHFQNKVKALQEIRRVLKEGGRVFVCHTSSRAWINNIHRQVGELRHDLLPDKGEMEGLLKAAGFEDVAVEDNEDSYFASGRKTDHMR